MKYVRYSGGNGFCGCDFEEIIPYKDDEIDDEVMEMTFIQMLEDNAESFSYVAFGWNESYTDEEYEEYLDGCEGNYNYVNREDYLDYCENYGFKPVEEE